MSLTAKYEIIFNEKVQGNEFIEKIMCVLFNVLYMNHNIQIVKEREKNIFMHILVFITTPNYISL